MIDHSTSIGYLYTVHVHTNASALRKMLLPSLQVAGSILFFLSLFTDIIGGLGGASSSNKPPGFYAHFHTRYKTIRIMFKSIISSMTNKPAAVILCIMLTSVYWHVAASIVIPIHSDLSHTLSVTRHHDSYSSSLGRLSAYPVVSLRESISHTTIIHCPYRIITQDIIIADDRSQNHPSCSWQESCHPPMILMIHLGHAFDTYLAVRSIFLLSQRTLMSKHDFLASFELLE